MDFWASKKRSVSKVFFNFIIGLCWVTLGGSASERRNRSSPMLLPMSTPYAPISSRDTPVMWWHWSFLVAGFRSHNSNSVSVAELFGPSLKSIWSPGSSNFSCLFHWELPTSILTSFVFLESIFRKPTTYHLTKQTRFDMHPTDMMFCSKGGLNIRSENDMSTNLLTKDLYQYHEPPSYIH